MRRIVANSSSGQSLKGSVPQRKDRKQLPTYDWLSKALLSFPGIDIDRMGK